MVIRLGDLISISITEQKVFAGVERVYYHTLIAIVYEMFMLYLWVKEY